MLQVIQKKITGWVAWFIVIAISITFVLWGVESSSFRGSANKDKTLAKVNGQIIGADEILPIMHQLKQQLAPNIKEFSPELQQFLVERAVELMVRYTTVSDAGFKVNEQTVQNELAKIPSFQDEKGFSESKFWQFLRQNQYTSPHQLFKILSMRAGTDQLKRGIFESHTTTDEELADYVRLVKQQRDFRYLYIKSKPFEKRIQLKNEDVDKFYEAHKEDFRIPERVSVQFIKLSMHAISTGLDISEKELNAYYQAHISDYMQPKKIKLAQIMLVQTEKRDAAQTLDLAKKIIKEHQTGKKFSELAKHYSDDPLTAREGGALGFIEPTWLEPGINQEVMQLKAGELSQPIVIDGGIQIIKVNNIQEAAPLLFEQVKSGIKSRFAHERANRIFSEKSEQLADLVFVNGDSLQPAADALKLEIQETPLFAKDSQDKPDIAKNTTVLNAVFSDELLKDGHNSQVLQLSDDELLVVRVKNHEPSHLQSKNEVSKHIRNILKTQIARSKTAEFGESLVKQIKQGNSVENLLKKNELSWQKAGLVERTNKTKLPNEVLLAAYAVPKPKGKNKTVSGVAVPEGYIIYDLKRVLEGDVKKTSEKEIEEIKQMVAFIQSNVSYYAYLKELESQASIEHFN